MNVNVKCNNVKGGREKRKQTKYNTQYVIKQENRSTWCKNLFVTLQFGNDPLVNKLNTIIHKDPPSCSYQWTLQSLIFTSFSNPTTQPACTAKPYQLNLAKLQCFTHNTQMMCRLCWLNLLSSYVNGRGERCKETKVFGSHNERQNSLTLQGFLQGFLSD